MIRLVVLFVFGLSWVSAALAQPADYSSPESTVRSYLEACRRGDLAAADQCYTASSRELLAQMPNVAQQRTPEQLQSFYQRLSELTFQTERVNPKRAILTPNDPKIPPFFLRIQAPQEQWRIDWHFMANYIRADQQGWSWKNPRALALWKSRP